MSPRLSPPFSSVLILFVVSCLWVLLTAALIGIMMEMMLVVDSAVTRLLGTLTPSMFFGASFLLQFYEFTSSWSVEGFLFWSDSNGHHRLRVQRHEPLRQDEPTCHGSPRAVSIF